MRRLLIAGAAGFLGSHLCDTAIARGDVVVGLDNFVTGRRGNIAHLRDDPSFRFIEHDVCDALPLLGPFDAVLHFASPASPRLFDALALPILAAGSRATWRLLEFAEQHRACFMLASTSEVYGDPLVHPQPESYRGNVSTTGPRSCYEEAKRFGEALTTAYHRLTGLDVRIARIFNTYGPRMPAEDGRVVSTFLAQALRGEPMTLFGDGRQTRSFCYIEDQVRGLLALLDASVTRPVNIGSEEEHTMLELAGMIADVTGSRLPLLHLPRTVDDPTQRRPDLSLARRYLPGWEAVVDLATVWPARARGCASRCRCRLDQLVRYTHEHTETSLLGDPRPARSV